MKKKLWKKIESMLSDLKDIFFFKFKIVSKIEEILICNSNWSNDVNSWKYKVC